MRLTIFGSGYVGLVTGACMAEMGNHVVCVDIDEDKIARLNAGEVPIYEPGLESYLRRNTEAGRLEFTTDVAKGVEHGLFQFIAVGTADKVRDTIQAALTSRAVACEFDVVSNPEFLKEGAAIGDFMKPERIIVGTNNPRTTELLHALYEPFNRNRDRLISMDIRSAELTKYAANAMLATRISFMNELANIAERVGADIEKVRVGIGSDPRIGYQFIYPGTGYGGSCFPKDVRALEKAASAVGYEADLLKSVDAVNNRQKHRLFRQSHSGQRQGLVFRRFIFCGKEAVRWQQRGQDILFDDGHALAMISNNTHMDRIY